MGVMLRNRIYRKPLSNYSQINISSKGFIAPMAVILIPVILISLAFVITILHQRTISANLQTIADLASKAGSAAACSTKECFDESRMQALNLIEKHITQNTGTLDLQQNDTVWVLGDHIINLDRGRWLASSGFQAFEHEWQTQNPGVPNFMAYNSVKVSITRNHIYSFIPDMLGGFLSSSVSAVAVAKLPSSTESVPPFAIPVCSLLASDGKFKKETICDADRLFTESNRYCPAGNPNCDIVPDFNFSPLSQGENARSWSEVYHDDPNVVRAESMYGYTISGCSYFSQRYQRASENFGVVGIPGSSAAVTEANVQAILNNYNGLANNVAIGDPFSILDTGLTASVSGDRMEVLQKSNPLGNSADYPSFSGVNWSSTTFMNIAFAGMNFRTGCTNGLIFLIGIRPTFGVCRSRRNHWGREDSGSIQGDGTGNWGRYASLIQAESHVDRAASKGSVWKVRLPVIAETGPDGRACLGTFGNSTEDPSPSTRANNSSYQIIGFITAYVYDSDIGEGPAVLPSASMSSSLLNSMMIRSYEWSGGGPVVDAPPTFPFGFRPDPSAAARSCNVVRARLDCKSSLFPSADDRAQNDPYLVN